MMPGFLWIGALSVLALLASTLVQAEPEAPPFRWPEGKRAALSLTFDDARLSQADVGLPLFERLEARATFYVVPAAVERRLEAWKKAAADGHEIGNHSTNHPCSGNFPFARQKALEEYTLERMREELVGASRRLQELLGVTPESFAYPCGQKFVGRGVDTRSYVPLVAGLFLSGRGWMDEGPNDPAFCDLAQLTGMEMDGKEFADLLPVLEQARERGSWVVLAGHDIGEGGRQTTRVATLEALVRHARDPASGLWLAPVGAVARYVRERRGPAR